MVGRAQNDDQARSCEGRVIFRVRSSGTPPLQSHVSGESEAQGKRNAGLCGKLRRRNRYAELIEPFELTSIQYHGRGKQMSTDEETDEIEDEEDMDTRVSL